MLSFRGRGERIVRDILTQQLHLGDGFWYNALPMDITTSESHRSDLGGAKVPTELSQFSGEGAAPVNWSVPLKNTTNRWL